MRTLALILTAAAAPAAASAASAAIVIEQPQIRASIGTQDVSAAYMVVRNTGKSADKLLGAECACASMVMMHQTTLTGGIARMGMEGSVTVPPGGEVRFSPNGRHLMLSGVKAPIRAGAKVPVVLKFQKAGSVTAVFTASETPGMSAAPAPAVHQHTH